MKNFNKLLLAGLIGAIAITGIQANDVSQDEIDTQVSQLEEAFKEAATELEEKNSAPTTGAQEKNNTVGTGINNDVDTSAETQLPEEEEIVKNTPATTTEQEQPEGLEQEYLNQLAEQIEQDVEDYTDVAK